MSGKQSQLLESGMVIAVVTAILYCVSAAYNGGYFYPLQLDSDVLDQNFHQVLYNGFLVSFVPAFEGLIIYVLLRILYSHALFPEFNNLLRKSWGKKRWFIKQKQRFFGKGKDSKIEQDKKQYSIKILVYSVFFLGFLLSMVYFESIGKKAAYSILEKIETKSIQENELISVKIDEKLEKLFYLMCGARNCAGINPKTKVVYYFPQNGHSYQLRERKGK